MKQHCKLADRRHQLRDKEERRIHTQTCVRARLKAQKVYPWRHFYKRSLIEKNRCISTVTKLPIALRCKIILDNPVINWNHLLEWFHYPNYIADFGENISETITMATREQRNDAWTNSHWRA